jgi:predicted naringenin-chalcone synthase
MAFQGGRPAILAVGTAVPEYHASQAAISEWMAASFVDHPAQARIIRTLCAYSGIETRYSCNPDYLLPPQESRFAPGVEAGRSPSTAERMAIYEQKAPPLGAEAAWQALVTYAGRTGGSAADVAAAITHLVVVSCTGFFAPGIDFVIAQRLNLLPTVERSLIGFMGCAAMFNGLRAAMQFVQANRQALVLVVSVELCSLHSQPNPMRDHLIGSSVFADGASACLIGMPSALNGDYFTLEKFHTSMKPDTESEMAWQIGNYGFSLRLSPRVPDHLAEAAPGAVSALFDGEEPQFWAIHPGGRAIIDRLVEIFELSNAHVAASRAVLRRYGNLSSATILFVLAELQRLLRQKALEQPNGQADALCPGSSSGCEGVAMSFGPGLVIEMARLAYVAPVAAYPDLPARSLARVEPVA